MELGAFAEQHGLHEPGGAALLQLRTGKEAKVQAQPPLAQDEDPGWARELVGRAVRGMSGARFTATAGEACRPCSVKSSCPLQPEGQASVRGEQA